LEQIYHIQIDRLLEANRIWWVLPLNSLIAPILKAHTSKIKKGTNFTQETLVWKTNTLQMNFQPYKGTHLRKETNQSQASHTTLKETKATRAMPKSVNNSCTSANSTQTWPNVSWINNYKETIYNNKNKWIRKGNFWVIRIQMCLAMILFRSTWRIPAIYSLLLLINNLHLDQIHQVGIA